MPFTPLHWGPALLIGLLAYRYLDFPTFLISSVMVDVKTTLVFFGLLGGPLHGFFHSFAGATVLAVALIPFMIAVREHPAVVEAMEKLLKPQEVSKVKVAAASFLGAYIHVVLDAIIYTDVSPLVPLTNANPLYGLTSVGAVFGFCVISLFLGFVYYLYILIQQELS